MHTKVNDGTVQPVVFDLWVKPQTNGLHEFTLLFSILLQIDRLQLTAVNCSKDPFSQCENLQNLQGIHIQVKSEYVGNN